MIYESGTSSVETESRHAGVGRNSGVFATTSTSGITRTKLAELAAPPIEQKSLILDAAIWAGFIFSVLLGFLFQSIYLALICLFLILIVVGVVVHPKHERLQKAFKAEHQRAYEEWLQTVMCDRCGATWRRVHSNPQQ